VRLSEFIRYNSEKIISEWEAFARSLDPDGTMDVEALRDHAQGMLTEIARDLETPQTEREGKDKSKGQSDSDETGPDTPAQEHGSGRAESGFTFEQMVSEYRAMRASVIRLWSEATGELKKADIEDLIRFSEAIDQALAESTSRFVEDLDYTKEIFLGILGHDLRTPLGAMITSAQFMLELDDLNPTQHKLTTAIQSSGVRMTRMVDDLLEFTRGRLGVSIPVERGELDLEKVLRDAIEEINASRSDNPVILKTSGDLHGEWDGARLSQVLSNLLSNAVGHGSAGTPVTVTAQGDADQVAFSVHNQGRPIPQQDIKQIFNPLRRSPSASRDSEHLGLGLYIVERIVAGHGGTIGVESSEVLGTKFTVRLPKRPASPPLARSTR
jgi:signal transduction histidine kinase